MLGHDLPRDEEAETQPRALGGSLLQETTTERIEHAGQEICWDGRPSVVDFERGHAVSASDAHVDRADAVDEGIRDEVGNDLRQPIRIPCPADLRLRVQPHVGAGAGEAKLLDDDARDLR
jgi:hypothetical protein